MKIWELLTPEYIGKSITSSDNLLTLSIIADENDDISVFDGQGQRIAISKLLLQEEWEIVELKGFERAALKAPYFYVNSRGFIAESVEEGTISDELNEINVNYFADEELANRIKDIDLINRKLEKFRIMYDTKEIDWKDEEQVKYHIRIDTSNDDIAVAGNSTLRRIGTVYFASKEVAQKALESVLMDIKKVYL